MFMAALDPSLHGVSQMTMFSADNRQLCGGGGGYGDCYGGEGFHLMNYCFSSGVGSDLVDVSMAEGDLRTDQSSSKDEERDEGWLQLSIGGHGPQHKQDDDQTPNTKHNGSGVVELELMPSSSSNHSQMRPEFRAPRPVTGFNPSFYLQHPGISSSSFHPHQEINWAFRPVPVSIGATASSFSSPSGSFFPRPFQLYAGLDMAAPPPGPGVDFRVIQPPRRPHSGIWFMLQASQNQEKEPFLPQISKSYLRIKDGRMTIRLVIKYLVNKLSLEDESQIEIRCKGQRLVPFLTLQHVRDNIWSSQPRDFVTLLPNSSTINHIMVLHYARTTTSSN